MSSAIFPLHVDTDNLILIQGLKSQPDRTAVTDATVTFTLTDTEGSAIEGATDISMSLIEDSSGDYRGVLDDTVPLVAGTSYYLEITVVKDTLQAFRRIPCEAVYGGDQ